MNFFKRLFGKSDKEPDTGYYDEPVTAGPEALGKTVLPDADPPADEPVPAAAVPDSKPAAENTPATFRTELYDSLNRYFSSPELRVELNLTDAQGTTFAEHEAFNATFDEWQKIRSVWDRRAVLFGHWDQTEFSKLQKWQVIERFVKDRLALQAVEYQNANISTDDFQDIRLIIAFSKLYRVLDAHPTALRYAKGAYELRPDLDIVKTEYANVLHLSESADDRKLAHSLINDVIEEKIAAADAGGSEVPLLSYFLFAPGYIDSSVFAASFLKGGNAAAEAWTVLAEEYYWCPDFRYEHAVYLSESGDTLPALAKLNALADEFPWYKTGVLGTIEAIRQLRTHTNRPDMMQTEMARMEQYRSMW